MIDRTKLMTYLNDQWLATSPRDTSEVWFCANGEKEEEDAAKR